jgi:hypothetical protein
MTSARSQDFLSEACQGLGGLLQSQASNLFHDLIVPAFYITFHFVDMPRVIFHSDITPGSKNATGTPPSFHAQQVPINLLILIISYVCVIRQDGFRISAQRSQRFSSLANVSSSTM